MSKIGKQLIKIPDNLKIKIDSDIILFENNNGQLKVPILFGVEPKLENNVLSFSLKEKSKQAKSNWGTIAALCKNAILGLVNGYKKTLILEGVGYKVQKEGDELILNLGFSHPIRYKPPINIFLEVEKNNIIHVKGFDKYLVGQVAAEIRSFRKPEPYKGKGIRYINEIIKRKEGKKSTGGK